MNKLHDSASGWKLKKFVILNVDSDVKDSCKKTSSYQIMNL